MTQNKFNRSVFLLPFLAILANNGNAGMPRSENYALEYAATGAGGGEAISLSGDYAVISQITSEGVAGGTVSSSSYSIEPLIGSSTETSSVAHWSLY